MSHKIWRRENKKGLHTAIKAHKSAVVNVGYTLLFFYI